MASSPASPDRDATPWLLVGAAAAVLAVVAGVAAIGRPELDPPRRRLFATTTTRRSA
jgi:hypothetical protein